MTSTEVLPGLAPMVEEVERAGGDLAPSLFWRDLADRNVEMLARDGGVAEFKRSVNNNYFQWIVAHPDHPDFRAVLRHWARRPTLAPVRARLDDPPARWGHEERPTPAFLRPRGYALYVALLWEYARRVAGPELADRLEEPALGRPVVVRHRRQAISQDLANSLLEYAAVVRAVPSERLAAPRLLEIGGGYGRLAWLWLVARPRARMVMVDIPPALALAQEYLSRVLPHRTVARFRPRAEPGRLHEDVMASDLAFLTPNQFADLPSLEVDIALNVSSLHEMRREQMAHYLELVDRHARGGFFYTKQWRHWVNPLDGVVADRSIYPYPAGWRRIYDRVHPVQVRFFEALFAVQ